MKITTLIENLASKPGLVAEHGLSIYIETDTRKILFDTGQSGLFIQNAQVLNIDISQIDTVILSHGHYDHTGGLYPFLEKNTKANVYAKRGIFDAKYSKNRFVGTPHNEQLLNNRLIYIDRLTEIAPNIFIVPEITISEPLDTHFKELTIKKGENHITDEFADELFLVINQCEQLQIITACSHRGITNICNTAHKQFNLPVQNIIGGFHMKECTLEQYVQITHYLRELSPKSIGVCHCTGVEKFAEIYNECDSRVFYNFTGSVLELPT
jgi:7,8-dihydropterin-6-yl-methyl-4-(beta-D-ribofuranosyl)aminobenzene 5'-phosphate synthase